MKILSNMTLNDFCSQPWVWTPILEHTHLRIQKEIVWTGPYSVFPRIPNCATLSVANCQLLLFLTEEKS